MPAGSQDEAVAWLWEEGTLGLEERPAPFGSALLLAYFNDSPGLVARLQAGAAARDVPLKAIPVPEVDWVARFREGFTPREAGGFWVAPPWSLPAREEPDRPLLVVDPGQAFGTGTHESTRLCLSALTELSRRQALGSVVDLGTGSGILAVAACRRGAAQVTAVDLDPDALDSARRHAALNGVQIHLVRGDVARPLAGGRFDLVLANLSAVLLRQRSAEIAGLGTGSAAFVLSGFLTDDVAELREACAGLGTPAVRTDGEWAAFLFERGGR